MEVTVLLTVVRIPHVVHLVDRLARVLREILDRVLIAEVVAALNRVECVRLDTVLGIGDACHTVHAALRHRRCRARRDELRQDCDLQILVLRRCEPCAHPCAAAADDEHVVGHVAAPYLLRDVLSPAAEIGTGHEDNARRRRSLDKGAA